ncbi:class I SAM-dependent methyltransferase [Alkaliphilus transvaalensis]|uniref:class I SAM-dependent methyltransferase n=1 Tax=Alkaliphilus transvaalensis TaxID=114628 RepID=UPI000686B02C|nr:class I SAM-dependent methyltransferase [Alkaliphilus transvaalensis]
MNNIREYYLSYDEESRLIKDNAHKVEFDTSIHLLNKYIDANSKVLDIGAGTGRYTFYFAKKGASVLAIDFVERHVEIIENKLTKMENLKIRVEQGDALDLSRFTDEEFNTILCMGPLYHLPETEQQIKCLNECRRVLQTGGILAIAYINKSVHMEYGGNPYFVGLEPDYMESTLDQLGFKVREHIATDGVSPKIGRLINKLNEKQYRQWLDFNIEICKCKASIENTLHALIIAEKIEQPC